MTRAETLAVIKDSVQAEAIMTRGTGQVHWEGCIAEPGHEYCTIAWLLQEIVYLDAHLDVARMGLDAISATLDEHLSSLRRPT